MRGPVGNAWLRMQLVKSVGAWDSAAGEFASFTSEVACVAGAPTTALQQLTLEAVRSARGSAGVSCGLQRIHHTCRCTRSCSTLGRCLHLCDTDFRHVPPPSSTFLCSILSMIAARLMSVHTYSLSRAPSNCASI